MKRPDRMESLIDLIARLQRSLEVKNAHLGDCRITDSWPPEPKTSFSNCMTSVEDVDLLTYFAEFDAPSLTQSEYLILLRTLLEHGFDPNLKIESFGGRPTVPLTFLTSFYDQQADWLPALDLLISFGANPNPGLLFQDCQTPLECSVTSLNLPLTQHLVSLGADPHLPCYPHDSLLFTTVLNYVWGKTLGADTTAQSIQMLSYLIGEGLNPLDLTPQGHTLLHCAVQMPDVSFELIDFLVLQGLDLKPSGTPPCAAKDLAYKHSDKTLYLHLCALESIQDEVAALNAVIPPHDLASDALEPRRTPLDALRAEKTEPGSDVSPEHLDPTEPQNLGAKRLKRL